MVAHSLARAAGSWASHHVFGFSPFCIEPFLINDELILLLSKKKKTD